MDNNVVKLNDFKLLQIKKTYNVMNEEERCNDTDLFIELVTKGYSNLTIEEKEIMCNEAKEVGSLLYDNKHMIYVVSFRQQLYVVHDLGEITYEYLGKFDEVIDIYLKEMNK